MSEQMPTNNKDKCITICDFMCKYTSTDWQQRRGKSSLYRRPVRNVVIIFTLTELMCLEPISRIRAITLVKTCTKNRQTCSL